MSVSHAPPRHLYGQLLGEPLTHAAWRIHALLLLLLPIMAWQVIVPAHQEPNFGIELADGQLVIRDLAAHISFARAFWAEGGDYSVASHIQITNAWCGQDVNRALPFGYSPTMLWLLAPFCALTTKWGFIIWTLINGGAVWWMAQRRRSVCLIGALALVSPLTMISMALGQTSLLTSAGIIFLMLRHRRADLEATERWSWLLVCEVVVLWALTAKPPLAIAAAAAMLVGRRWKTVCLAIALSLVTTLLLTPKLGYDWVAQYVALLSNYDREMADAAFAWSLRPDHMSNLRSLLWSYGVIGDHVASQISTVCWLISTAAIVVAGAVRKLPGYAAWALVVLAYLLFCPHLTSTEDLHLIVVVAWSVVYLPNYAVNYRFTLAVLALIVALFAPDNLLPVGGFRSSFIFGVKLSILAVVCAALRSCREPKTLPETPRLATDGSSR